MNKFTKLISASALLAFASAASALPTIVGDIAFSSETDAFWTPVDSADVATTLALSTGITFTAGVNGFDQNVVSANGDFSGTETTGVDFLDFQFDPLTSGTPLWTFDFGGDTYSFTMNAVTTLSKGNTSILLEGTGFMSIDGYEDTFGTWDFSGNTFSYSSSAAPEPALILLLATGLIGFGFARRARKAA